MIREINLIETSAPQFQLTYHDYVIEHNGTSELVSKFEKLEGELPVVDESTIREKTINFLRNNAQIFNLSKSELEQSSKTINDCIIHLSRNIIHTQGKKSEANTIVVNKDTLDKFKIEVEGCEIIVNNLVLDDEIFVLRKSKDRGDNEGYCAIYCYNHDMLYFNIYKIGSRADKHYLQIRLTD